MNTRANKTCEANTNMQNTNEISNDQVALKFTQTLKVLIWVYKL